MSNIPSIFSLIKSSDDISALLSLAPPCWPAPLNDVQLEALKETIDSGEQCQQAIFAGLSVLSQFVFNAGESQAHGLSDDCNELSWIMKHLTHELEAITDTINSSNTWIRLAHDYQLGKRGRAV